jgi:hypothetical protein
VTQPAQNFENHARFVPGYHFVLSGMVLLYLIYSVAHLVRHHTLGALAGVGVAVCLLLITWYERAFAVGVQDRVIRLEERLRYERVLPADLRARTEGLSRGQVVALRFAHDDELPALVKQTLDGGLDNKAIKQQIKSWRADHMRV